MSRQCAILRRERHRRRLGERGAVAIETVMIVPAVVLILSIMVAGWRIADARSQVEASADAAGRAASLQRSGTAAHSQAVAVAAANLQAADIGCRDPQVQVDTDGFQVPVGQPASIQVTVTCTVTLADLLVPGLPGTMTISRTAVVPLDRHKQRGP